MDIATKLTDLTNDLRACRNAITEKGGEISANAGFAEVAEKILEISTGSNIGTVTDATASLIKQVPDNSISHCFVKSIGGMTYKCNNLIPFPYYSNRGAGDYTQSGVTFTIGEDRVVNLTGTGTAIIEFTLFQGYLPAGIYTMSGINATNNTAYYMQMRDKDGNWYKNAATIDDNANRGTFTITAEEANQYYCRLNLRIASGVKFTNFKMRPMLNAGTTALPYEDYYEGLRDTKPTAIKVSGANLIPFPYYSKSNISYGITTTVNDDGSITFNGTAEANVAFIVASSAANIILQAEKYYTISGNCINNNWPDGVFFSVSVQGKYTSINKNTQSARLDLGSKVTDLRIVIPVGMVCENVVFKPMLNIGSVAAPYKPYHEPITYPIPEAVQGTGKGVDDASDTMDFENGKLIAKTKTIALGDVGSSQMTSVGGSVNPYVTDDGITAIFSYNINDFDTNLRTKALCSHLPVHTDWTGKTFGVSLVPNGSSSYLKVSIKAADAGVSTSDEYNTIVNKIVQWLRDNNVTLTYALAEPTEESLSVGFGLLPVEGGGTLEIITDNGKVIPNTVIYQTIG